MPRHSRAKALKANVVHPTVDDDDDGKDEGPDFVSNKMFRFVWSAEVSKAFHRIGKKNTADVPSGPTAVKVSGAPIQILKLPQLYSEMVFMKRSRSTLTQSSKRKSKSGYTSAGCRRGSIQFPLQDSQMFDKQETMTDISREAMHTMPERSEYIVNRSQRGPMAYTSKTFTPRRKHVDHPVFPTIPKSPFPRKQKRSVVYCEPSTDHRSRDFTCRLPITAWNVNSSRSDGCRQRVPPPHYKPRHCYVQRVLLAPPQPKSIFD